METDDIFRIIEVNLGGINYIFPLMNDKDNIRHYIVARHVCVTIATNFFPMGQHIFYQLPLLLTADRRVPSDFTAGWSLVLIWFWTMLVRLRSTFLVANKC